MDQGTLLNLALVMVFVLVGGVFAATELALVSLRESQLTRMEQQSSRGARVAAVARNPNRFLAAVQIGVTVAGFLSAAYGASTLAPDFVPVLVDLGLGERVAGNVALVALTLFIAYLSLVFGELVPKRFALQKSAQLSIVVGPPLDRFATLMRPVIWLLSVSTNAVVRLLGGDPSAKNEEMSEEELRDLVAGHESLGEDERRFVSDMFVASQRSVKEVMRPRGDIVYLPADTTVREALQLVKHEPYSRYPVADGGPDRITGFVHVRDLHAVGPYDRSTVGDLARRIVLLPSTNQLFPAITSMRREGTHIALVVDEYGGTDGIVTLEDLLEELVGEIYDEFDQERDADHPDHPGVHDGIIDGGLILQEFEALTGIPLPDTGGYETVGGFVMATLGRIPSVGDVVEVGGRGLEVAEVDDRRVHSVRLRTATSGEPGGGEAAAGP